MTIDELLLAIDRLRYRSDVVSDQMLVEIDSGMDDPLLYTIYDVQAKDGHIIIGLKEESI